jgi:hypothetical protein
VTNTYTLHDECHILIEHRRDFLQRNTKVMNTGHLPLILPVECFICGKKSLKIPKGQSESVYRRTDNTKHAYTSKDRVTRTPLKTGG